MGLETTTPSYISSLDPTWPIGGDPRSQGDDHIRLIKKTLKNVFPGSGGLGFSTPILAVESELNFLSGLDRNIMVPINRAYFSLNKAANQSPIGTNTIITWSGATFDNKGGYSGNTYTIPAGEAGIWLLYNKAASLNGACAYSTAIFKNGVQVMSSSASATTGTQASPFNIYLDNLSVGDVLDCRATFISGTTTLAGTSNGGTAFIGFRLL